MPTQFTTTSIRPNFSIARSTMAAGEVVMSCVEGMAEKPSAVS